MINLDNKGAVTITQISLLILYLVLLILTVILLCLKPFKKEYHKSLINNWETNPIKEIEIVEEDSSETETIDSNGIKDIKNFNGNFFKLTREDTNYLKMSKETNKECGTDSYGNKLYIENNKECPINFIYIGTSPPKVNFDFKKITLKNNKQLYFSNQNTNGKIVINLNVGGILGCGICHSIEDYCDYSIELCKYKDKSSSIIDTILIKDYINDNSLKSSIYDNNYIGLYYQNYISLEKNFQSSKLQNIKDMKNKQFICDIIQLILIFISGIFVLITFKLEDTLYNIVLGFLNVIIIIPVIILSHLNIQRYNSILDKISYIAHPIKEDFLYKKNWFDVQLTILIISSIYLIISFISLILFILIKIEKINCSCSCTICDFYPICELNTIIQKQKKIIKNFFTFDDLYKIFFEYNDILEYKINQSKCCRDNNEKRNEQKKFIKKMIDTIKELKNFYKDLNF